MASQKKIELPLEEYDIPIIGYFDLLYDDCVRDIKTGYARSALPNGHARQLSLYGSALRKTPYVDYVSKSKVTSFEFLDSIKEPVAQTSDPAASKVKVAVPPAVSLD